MAYEDQENWRPSGIDDLEPNAWEALRSHGSICVAAGPGSGKTEFLAQKAAYLLQTGICQPPYKILAISFKRDAAENLAARLKKRCPQDQANRFVSMTFDSFTKSLLDRFYAAIPEQWRPTDPFEIVFPKTRQVRDLLALIRSSAPAQWQSEIAGLITSDLESRFVGGHRLVIGQPEPATGIEFVVQSWWAEFLRGHSRSSLTFVMINRLSELLIRANPHVLRAIRATYPFVFVDEFQDTTYAQYDFLLSVFGGGSTVVTAVGDDKQRIMVWAGARDDAFNRLTANFGARRIPLLMNFRSSPDLVRIQHIVARALDSGSIETQAQVERIVDGDVAQIWTIPDEATEASQLAEWLSEDIRQRGTHPRDYAILVRQTADRFEAQLSAPFEVHNLSLRNESKTLGRTTLQDLLAERLTCIVMALLRLGIQQRAPEAWMVASEAILQIRNADSEDYIACNLAESQMNEFLCEIRDILAVTPPTADSALDIGSRILTFLDPVAIARTYPEYGLGESLEIASEGFLLHLVASAKGASNWGQCIDVFEGANQLSLMTVHKSKGLEFDTIVFVGLDDEMWWSHSAGNPEGIATFFVALSRAKQRAIFTFCRGRGQRRRVADLYQLLADAGVPEIAF